MQDAIDHAASLLLSARYAVALTGAGISTPSGIPDFRSPNTGLWEKANPYEIGTIYGFLENPARFYDWIRPLAITMRDALPNPAHYALAQMERAKIIHAVISQNIDGLHQRAGSTCVSEVHGHVREATCMNCYTIVPAESYLTRFISDGETPRCPNCNGIMKPNVTLFGEALPARPLLAATQAARRCDVMLIAGSSLEVSPAADLPDLALAHQAKLIIVNLTPTHMDGYADVVIHDNVAQVLPGIAARIEVAMDPSPD